MKRQVKSIILVSILALLLTGCGGGTVGSDRASIGEGGGEARSVKFTAATQVLSEEDGSPVAGVAVYTTNDRQEANSGVHYTDESGIAIFKASSDEGGFVQVSIDNGTLDLGKVPTDLVHMNLRVSHTRDERGTTLDAEEIELELASGEKKKDKKNKAKDKTKEDFQVSLESTDEDGDSLLGQGGNDKEKLKEPVAQEDKTDSEILVDEIDLNFEG